MSQVERTSPKSKSETARGGVAYNRRRMLPRLGVARVEVSFWRLLWVGLAVAWLPWLISCASTGKDTPAPTPNVPDHQAWSRQLEEGREALQAGDLDAAEDAAVGVFHQALYFSDTDRRLTETYRFIWQLLEAQNSSGGPRRTLPMLRRMDDVANREGASLSSPAIRVRVSLTRSLAKLQKRKEAERIATTLHRETLDRYGAGDPRTLDALRSLVTLVGFRDPERALEIGEPALDAARQALGPSAPETMSLQEVLGDLQGELGRYDDAEKSFSEVLAAAESVAPASVAAGRAQCAFGRLRMAQGRPGQALEHYDRCRAVFEVNFGETEVPFLEVLLTLAAAQRANGDMAAAYQSVERARRIVERQPSLGKLMQAWILSRLAELHLDAGQRTQAERLAQTAAQLLGEVDDAPPLSLFTLSEVQSRLGLFDAAIDQREQMLADAEEGGSPSAIAMAENNLAYTLARSGEGERAIPLAERSAAFAEKRLGRDDVRYVAREQTWGLALAVGGHPEEGLHKIDRALATSTAHFGERSPHRMEMLQDRAEVLLRLGRREEAAQALASVAQMEHANAAQLAGAHGEARALVVADGNFRITTPGEPWIVMPSGTLESKPSVVLMRTGMTFFVHYWVPRKPASSLDTWVETELERRRSEGESIEILSQEPRTLAGIEGRRVQMSLQSGKTSTYIDEWFGVHNGVYYDAQGSGYASSFSAEEVAAETDAVLAGFSLIDPSRHVGLEGFVYHSPRFGYSIDLSDEPWVESPEKNDVDHAEFGASIHGAGSIITMPVWTAGVQSDDETWGRALLASMGFTEAGEARHVAESRLEGVEFHFERERNYGRQTFRVRLLRRGEVVCLVSAAVGPQAAERKQRLLAAVERFHWDGEPLVTSADALTAAEAERHRQVLDQIAAQHLREQDRPAAIDVMVRRLPLAPDDVAFREQLAGFQLGASRYRDALATLSPGLERAPDRAALWALQAIALHHLEGAAAAVPSYRRAFELGYEDDRVSSAFADALVDAGEREEALEMLGSEIGRSGSRALRLKRVAILGEMGRLDEARSEIAELTAAAPSDTAVLPQLALLEYQSGDLPAVLETVDRILALTPDAWDVLYLKALAQRDSGSPREAKATIDRAAELNPDSAEVAQLQTLIEAHLGEGSLQGARDPLEPVAVPESLLGGGPTEAPRDASAFGAYYDLWVEALHFERGVAARRTSRFRARILDVRGLGQFSNLQFEFNPLWQRIFVNEITVLGPDGTPVAAARTPEQSVLDAASSPEGGSTKVLNVAIPGLAVGTSVEAVVTREELHPDGFTYQDLMLARAIPVSRWVVYAEGDVEDLAIDLNGGLERSTGPGWVAWSLEDGDAYRWEPFQDPELSHVPRVRIADARNDWEGLVRDYLDVISDRLAPSSAVAKVAAEMQAPEGKPRAQAIADYVQSVLRYEAVAFGPRARVPKAVDRTLEDRYGDCKDHSLLLLQLLRAAGYDAKLALVNRSENVRPSVPSLDQFDHMIVYCQDCPDSPFLDATDKEAPLGNAPPRTLGGKSALILDGATPRFEEIAAPSPDDFVMTIERSAEVGEEGGLAVREDVVFEGQLAAQLRSSLRSMDRVAWEDLLQREILGGDNPVRLRDLRIENADALREPLHLSLEYELEHAFAPDEQRLLGRLPSGWERLFLAADGVEHRISPFAISDPLRISGHVRLRVPRGGVARVLGRREHAETSPFLQWNARSDPLEDGLAVQFSAVLKRGTFPAGRYSAYVETVGRAVGFLQQPVEVERR